MEIGSINLSDILSIQDGIQINDGVFNAQEAYENTFEDVLSEIVSNDEVQKTFQNKDFTMREMFSFNNNYTKENQFYYKTASNSYFKQENYSAFL